MNTLSHLRVRPRERALLKPSMTEPDFADTAARRERLHVVGCPRSGTTLIAELLRYAYAFRGAAAHEQSLFVPVGSEQYPFLSKKPSDTVRIDAAFLGDPNLYVIAMVRDPRSVVTSVHWSRPQEYFVDFARWRQYAEHIRRYCSHPRYLMVRYEDLLTHPARVQQRIEAKVPWLVRERSFAQFPEGLDDISQHSADALKGARPLDAGRCDGWMEHLPRIRSELDAHPDMCRLLQDFGYEEDERWTQALRGLTGSGSTAKTVRTGWWRRLETSLRYWLRNRRYLRGRAP